MPVYHQWQGKKSVRAGVFYYFSHGQTKSELETSLSTNKINSTILRFSNNIYKVLRSKYYTF